MVTMGVPKDMDSYYMADEQMAFILNQAGFHPRFMDEDVVYFKLNNKLIKYLKKIGENQSE